MVRYLAGYGPIPEPAVLAALAAGGPGPGGGVSEEELAAAVDAALDEQLPPAVTAAVAAAGGGAGTGGGGGGGVTGTVNLFNAALGGGDTFRSPWVQRGGDFPDDGYTTAQLITSAGAAHTAVMQGSPNGIDGVYELATYTVNVANGVHSISQTFTRPAARYLRWQITATAPITLLTAKVVLA